MRAASSRLKVARVNQRVHVVLSSQVLSWLGDAFHTVALPVAIAVNGGGALQMSASVTSVVVARLVFTLFGGVWSDRIQPVTVMAVADLVRAFAAGSLAVGFATGEWSLGLVIMTALLIAGAGSFFQPAFLVWRTAMISEADRQRTNGALTSLRSLMSMLGPVLGGSVVGFCGAAAGFTINALTFLASFVLVVVCAGRIQSSETEAAPRFLAQVVEGWQAVRERSWLLTGLIAAGVYHVGNGAVLVLAPLLVAREYGGAQALGIVSAAEGLGGFLGAALGARVRIERPMFYGWMPLLLMPLWAASFAFAHTVWVVAVLGAIGYAGLLFYDVHWETAIQQAVPLRLQGRVHSWDILLSFVALPVGSMAAAPLAQMWGARTVIAVGAVILFLAAFVPLFVPSMRRFRLPSGGVSIRA